MEKFENTADVPEESSPICIPGALKTGQPGAGKLRHIFSISLLTCVQVKMFYLAVGQGDQAEL